jgi:hypothetical protein
LLHVIVDHLQIGVNSMLIAEKLLSPPQAFFRALNFIIPYVVKEIVRADLLY